MRRVGGHSKILIVDDSETDRKIIRFLLKGDYPNLCEAKNGEDAIRIASENELDLILMDISMPDMDGYETCRAIKGLPVKSNVPVLFITGEDKKKTIMKAFDAGGQDFITKPVHGMELLARIKGHISEKIYSDMHLQRESELEEMVNEKTRQIESLMLAMVSSLETANLLNDEDTGKHVKRISLYSSVIAREWGFDGEFVKNIGLFSSLHDIGKVGIPESILRKPGKLTAEEYDRMKQHVSIGSRMICSPELPPMARNIVEYHHEKWNGEGYLKGLQGEAIPVEARIVAIADVYDALCSKRVYKDAMTQESALETIQSLSGTHFQPELVEIFTLSFPLIRDAADSMADTQP